MKRRTGKQVCSQTTPAVPRVSRGTTKRQGLNINGVYGFISLEDAIEFCELNQGIEMNLIVAFDVPEGCER